jgi:hypothetical protein
MIWFESFYDDDSRIWALNPENMNEVYDLGDGQIWAFT